MLNRKQNGPAAAFMNWTRSVAMWVVWNVPIGRFAPSLMGYAMRSTPRLTGSRNLSARSKN